MTAAIVSPKEKQNGHVGLDDITQEMIQRGPLSATYDAWAGKKVKVVDKNSPVAGKVGKVVGVNPRPFRPRELSTVESGWLEIEFDGFRDNALPEQCEVVG